VAGDLKVSPLRAELERYLQLRNSLGHKLKLEGFMLRSFVSFMEQRSASTITIELALAWAMLPAEASAAWRSQRLSAVRGFARHLRAIDPATEVPPPRLIVAARPRFVLYPLSEEHIVRITEAAGRLSPTLRGVNYATLFPLLAVTGMRVGEGLALDDGDVVFSEGLIHIRDAKFGKARDIPVHESTVAALDIYRIRRNELAPALPGSFFVSHEGRRLSYGRAQAAFAESVGAVGLGPIATRRRPGLHDLRRRFATEAVATLYKEGLDPVRYLPRLSTYLGHVDPAATYRYIAASPELMSVASDRLSAFLGELP
jgi:integrase/recombinase XerD